MNLKGSTVYRDLIEERWIRITECYANHYNEKKTDVEIKIKDSIR